jgi:hypothetical protein
MGAAAGVPVPVVGALMDAAGVSVENTSSQDVSRTHPHHCRRMLQLTMQIPLEQQAGFKAYLGALGTRVEPEEQGPQA